MAIHANNKHEHDGQSGANAAERGADLCAAQDASTATGRAHRRTRQGGRALPAVHVQEPEPAPARGVLPKPPPGEAVFARYQAAKRQSALCWRQQRAGAAGSGARDAPHRVENAGRGRQSERGRRTAAARCVRDRRGSSHRCRAEGVQISFFATAALDVLNRVCDLNGLDLCVMCTGLEAQFAMTYFMPFALMMNSVLGRLVVLFKTLLARAIESHGAITLLYLNEVTKSNPLRAKITAVQLRGYQMPANVIQIANV